MEASPVILPPKRVSDVVLISMDFASALAIGNGVIDSLTGTPTVTASVYSGTDPTPSAIVGASGFTFDSVVEWKIQNGAVGVIYALKYQMATTLGQTLTMVGLLAVVPDLT